MRNMASTAGYRNFLSNHPEENKPSTNTNVEATLQMSTNKHVQPFCRGAPSSAWPCPEGDNTIGCPSSSMIHGFLGTQKKNSET